MSEQAINKTTSPENVGILQQREGRSLSPFAEMDRLFEGFFPSGWIRPLQHVWPELAAPFAGRAPKVDILERDEEIVVRAELPGVDKNKLDVSLTDDSVTIKATMKQENEEEIGDYHHREISQGSFSRRVTLPIVVQSDKAHAAFKNGVLTLTLPKAAPAKRHNIKVE